MYLINPKHSQRGTEVLLNLMKSINIEVFDHFSEFYCHGARKFPKNLFKAFIAFNRRKKGAQNLA